MPYLFAGLALGRNQLRSNSRAKVRANMRSQMLASAQENMKIRANMQLFAAKAKKYGIKLPWANLDADGGEEKEFGNERDDISDPHLFSESSYEHTSAKDDDDVAENEEEDEDENSGEADDFKHGDESLLTEDSQDSSQDDD